MTGTPDRREAARFMVEREVSTRRACWWLGLGRNWLKYESARESKDVELLERLMELSREHPRFGSRRWAPMSDSRLAIHTGAPVASQQSRILRMEEISVTRSTEAGMFPAQRTVAGPENL